MRVFVLIFNVGTENEGIHSVRIGDRNQILMFESEDDATRYALMLEAQDFPVPSVEEIEDEEIKEFCQSANYDWELVTENSSIVVTPPELNVEETDWKPDGQTEETDQETKETLRPNPPDPTKPDLSDAELEKIRRKLEGLL
ncbi:hypothetical protein NIES2100_34440 [Calothrix sp. NIES-2100]|nr:hypothetical protein NIES2100_34440 [Calothrix sp. NIES-2100]